MSVHFHHDNARVPTSSFVERVEGFTNGACGMGRAVACYQTCAAAAASLLALHTRVPSSLSAPLTTLRSSSTVCSDAGRLLELKPRVIFFLYAGSGVFVLESAPGTKTPRILLARMSTFQPPHLLHPSLNPHSSTLRETRHLLNKPSTFRGVMWSPHDLLMKDGYDLQFGTCRPSSTHDGRG
jgi:hypothetical protein